MELSSELKNEKILNQNLNRRIQNLEFIVNNINNKQNLNEKENINLYNQDKNIINESNEKLLNLNNYISKEKYNQLLEEINIKDKILSNYPIKLLEGEKLMSVIFVSVDQKIHYSVICKNTDKFNIIENMLYEEYPEYMETENYFMVNGNKVNKYKSLKLNKIKNHDIIVLKNI